MSADMPPAPPALEVTYMRENAPAPDAALHAKQHRKTLLHVVDILNGMSHGVMRLAVGAQLAMPEGPDLEEIMREYRAAIETIDAVRSEVAARLDSRSA